MPWQQPPPDRLYNARFNFFRPTGTIFASDLRIIFFNFPFVIR